MNHLPSSKPATSCHWQRTGLSCLFAIAVLSQMSGCMTYQERMEEIRLTQQIEIDRQEALARQRREAEEHRRQEAYARWFNSLSPEQQIAITVEKEKSQRVKDQVQGELFGKAIEGISNVLAP